MSKGKKKRTKLWIFLFLVFSLSVSYYLVFETDVVTLKTVEFNVDERVSKESILKEANVSLGDSLLFMDQQQIANDLVSHPLIKEVVVTKHLPDRLSFDIRYRQPLFSIVHAGIYLTLDEDLVVIDMSDSLPDGYYVEGFVFDNYVKGNEIRLMNKMSLNRCADLIKSLRTSESGINFEKRIRFENGDEGRGIVFGVSNKFIVSIGDGENAADRLDNAIAPILEFMEYDSEKIYIVSLDDDYMAVNTSYKEQGGQK